MLYRYLRDVGRPSAEPPFRAPEASLRLKGAHAPTDGPSLGFSLQDHLAPGNGPKRILALDGGGVRGLLSLAVLERIEDILRARYGGAPSFCLADYFDLVGGTSTGSIIAAGLALGYRASELTAFYRQLGPKIFAAQGKGVFRPRHDSSGLREALNREINGDGEPIKLGSPRLRTGLAMVMKRVDTDSPWVVHNNPNGKFFHVNNTLDRPNFPNSEFDLVTCIRASTAAPTFFKPESIEVGRLENGQTETGRFIDGALTGHNNPALQLLMLASLEGHGFQWPLGSDQILLISIGTGDMAGVTEEDVSVSWRDRLANHIAESLPLGQGVASLKSMISATEDLVERTLHWMTDADGLREIDMEVGSMQNDFPSPVTHLDLPAKQKSLLTYRRFNHSLKAAALNGAHGMNWSPDQIKKIRQLTDPTAIDLAYELGQKVSASVLPDHFPAHFDLPAEVISKSL